MPAEASDSSPKRRYVLLALKISVSLILLVLLFSRIDAGGLWSTARRASIAWLLVALSIYTINVIASVWRWHLLLEAQRIAIPIERLIGSFLPRRHRLDYDPRRSGGSLEVAPPSRP